MTMHLWYLTAGSLSTALPCRLTASSRVNTFLPIFITICDAQIQPSKCNPYANVFHKGPYLWIIWSGTNCIHFIYNHFVKNVFVTKMSRTWRSKSVRGRPLINDWGRNFPRWFFFLPNCFQEIIFFQGSSWCFFFKGASQEFFPSEKRSLKFFP